MDGMAHPPAQKAGQLEGGGRREREFRNSEEHARLERLRRCASFASLGSFDGSEGDSEDWAFVPGAAAKARLVESKQGLWALARRAADGCVFFGTQSGEVRAYAPGSEGTAGVLLGQHSDGVYALVLSRDGSTLFSASQENIRCWNVAGDVSGLEGAPFSELTGHSESVYALAVSPDGRTLFSAGEDCTIRVWFLDPKPDGGVSATCVDVLDEHIAPITSLAVGPQGTLFSAGEDRAVRVWEPTGAAQGYACVALLDGHTAAVTSLLVAADGRTLFSGSWDQSVRVWEYWSEAIEPPADAAAAAARDQEDPTSRLRHRLVAVLQSAAPDSAVLCLALSPDGATLFTGGSDKAVHVWDLAEAMAAERRAASGAGASASAGAGSAADADEAAEGAADGSSSALSLSLLHRSVSENPLPRISETSAADADGDGDDGASSSPSQPASDASASEPVLIAQPPFRGAPGASPGYRARLEGHRRAVTSLLVLPDGCTLVSGSVDRTMREWKVALPKAWSPETHAQFPLGFRQGVQALLMAMTTDTQAPIGALGRLDWASRAGIAERVAEALAASSYGA